MSLTTKAVPQTCLADPAASSEVRRPVDWSDFAQATSQRKRDHAATAGDRAGSVPAGCEGWALAAVMGSVVVNG